MYCLFGDSYHVNFIDCGLDSSHSVLLWDIKDFELHCDNSMEIHQNKCRGPGLAWSLFFTFLKFFSSKI